MARGARGQPEVTVTASRREERNNAMHGDDNDDAIQPSVVDDSEEYDDLDEAEIDELSDELPDDVPASDVAERLRGLVVYLATNLVDDPNSVEVEARQRGSSVFVSLRVPRSEERRVGNGA